MHYDNGVKYIMFKRIQICKQVLKNLKRKEYNIKFANLNTPRLVLMSQLLAPGSCSSLPIKLNALKKLTFIIETCVSTWDFWYICIYHFDKNIPIAP